MSSPQRYWRCPRGSPCCRRSDSAGSRSRRVAQGFVPSATAGMQSSACSTTVLLPGTGTSGKPSPEFEEAWRFSRGEGQSVAIIDTGVKPSARLHVEPGGDYVQSTDGLTDCDGHGTMVAGIIGAQPGPDGFSGIAPAAKLISIRQESSKFSPRLTAGGDPSTNAATQYVNTLARSIVHAANLGARVINISSAECVPAAKPIDQAALGAALRYAVAEKTRSSWPPRATPAAAAPTANRIR